MAKAVIIIGEALMHLGCIYAELLGTMPMLAQAAGGGILREKAPDSGSMLIAERQCETVIDSAYGPHGISNHVLMGQIDDPPLYVRAFQARLCCSLHRGAPHVEHTAANGMQVRSEERRVGKGWVSTGRSRGSPQH